MNVISLSSLAIVDAARMGPAITNAKSCFPKQFVSLYKGESAKTLAEFAPYLFYDNVNTSEAIDWFIKNGWGKSWCIFIQSKSSVEIIYKHFRRYLIVNDERGRELYFRFYDPRVLRIFLPTCDAIQLREFFGPVHYFLLEDEDPAFAIYFWLEAGKLKSKKVDTADVIFV